jgi:FAD/FMN-containing dehydrogenase
LPHHVVELRNRDSAARDLAAIKRPAIAHGMGRSYGDACLNPEGVLLNTSSLDRFISFDSATGRITCEAGVVLRDIQRLMLPRGWTLPVVPGTQLVTVGGAIANDVHGKNHHTTGTFADHVVSLKLARSDGEVIDCGPRMRPEWFAATAGGIGLTGLVVQAELQLKPSRGPWLETEIVPFAGLDEFFSLSSFSEAEWEHTVSWIDCTVPELRGLFLRAREAGDQSRPGPRERRFAMPLTPPFSLIGRRSLRPLNAAYYALNCRRRGRRVLHQQQFLFPLDTVLEWNRIYGPNGFYQYQSVVPQHSAPTATAEMLQAIARSGEGSILAVLKTFGERKAPGLLSFVQPGVTLALDFGNRPAAAALFERLDAIVLAAGGRLYLAKDARMPRQMFEAGYPRLTEFLKLRDPGMSSAMSRRLLDR